MFSRFEGFNLVSISTVCPTSVSSNLEIEDMSTEDAEKLVKNIGIKSRHTSKSSEETLLNLFIRASNNASRLANIDPSSLKLLIVLTQSGEHSSPGISSKLHKELGMGKDALVFDVNLGCSGYVKGLHIAMSIMQSNFITEGLVLVGDTLSQFDMDKHKHGPLFGDGVSGTIVEYDPKKNFNKSSFELGSDGSGWEAITISHGIKRKLEMNGLDVMGFALREVPKAIASNIEKAGDDVSSIDIVVLHQANSLINTALERKIKFPNMPRALEKFGNTSGASIPIVLTTALPDNYFHSPRKILICGFGIGLSWASSILEINAGLKTSNELL